MAPPTTTSGQRSEARVAGGDGLTARAIAEAAERLATPAPIVVSTLDLIDASAPARIIAGKVGQSPELAAHVMRVANSALFGSPVDSIEKAVVRIGGETLRGLLLAASTYGLMESALPVYGLPRLALLKHSQEVADLTRTLVRRSAAALQSQAYIGGLLHDLGKPILASVAAEGTASVAPRGDTDGERRVFGTDHARVGTWIARQWGLSDEICEAIEYHHAPVAPEEPLGRALWLADGAAHASNGDERSLGRLPGMAEACGLTTGDLEAVLTTSPLSEGPRRPPGLTDRETEVLRVLATGVTAKQVAHQLGCSVSTVHNHLHRVYRKLGVSGQAQALLYAREKGWV